MRPILPEPWHLPHPGRLIRPKSSTEPSPQVNLQATWRHYPWQGEEASSPLLNPRQSLWRRLLRR
jgi:hypothetical protein